MREVPPLGGNAGDPFNDANPSTGTEGSVVPAEFFTAVRAEIIAVIVGAGLTPDETNLAQLLQAIDARIAAIAGDPAFNGVVSVNGDPGPAVTFNFPVDSVNGQLGNVVIDVGVTSVNGQSGAVTLDLSAAVTSVNNQTGAVTINVPVDSVNGQIGDVILTAADVGGVPTSRQITAGLGLSGGGTLAANRTLNVNFASSDDVRAGIANEAISPAAADAAAVEFVVAFAPTLNWSPQSAFHFVCDSITSNFTLNNPTSQRPGRSGTWRLFSPFERSISFGSMFKAARDTSLPSSIVGEVVLGWVNSYSGRIFIS